MFVVNFKIQVVLFESTEKEEVNVSGFENMRKPSVPSQEHGNFKALKTLMQ